MTCLLSRLGPTTLQNYTRPGTSTLKRGEAYVIQCWPKGPYKRQKLLLTERGLKRLHLKAYKFH